MSRAKEILEQLYRILEAKPYKAWLNLKTGQAVEFSQFGDHFDPKNDPRPKNQRDRELDYFNLLSDGYARIAVLSKEINILTDDFRSEYERPIKKYFESKGLTDIPILWENGGLEHKKFPSLKYFGLNKRISKLAAFR